MSSGKFCCKSWRKLLVPGTCPTPLLEVNYCFSCTAKNTCASIPAAPAHSPNTQLSSSIIQPPDCTKAWALLCFCPSVLQQTRRRTTPRACSPGSRARGRKSLLCPSWLFQVRGLPAASRGATAWHKVKGFLPYYLAKAKYCVSLNITSKSALFTWFGWVVFLSLRSWCDAKEKGQDEDLAEVLSAPR